MPIVCGTDFSEYARAAAAAAAALAGRLGRELTLAHVVEPRAEELDATAREQLRAQLQRRLRDAAAPLAELARGPVATAVLWGRPAAALREFALAQRASLVVVGSAGHGLEPLVRLGGQSERLAAAGVVPLLVVRDAEPFVAWARGTPLRALVGVDGSAAGASAVRFVEALRAAAAVDVVVGRVYYADEAHRRYGLGRRFSFTDPNPLVEAYIERDLKQVVPHLAGAGEVFYRARLAVGREADHLLELAEAERCQVVVLGAHRHPGLGRMWSVSAAALHHARTAVALVPVDAEAVALAPPRLGRVMAATDFSPLGDAAVPWAYALVEPGGEVVLAHVTLTAGAAGALVESYVAGPPSSQARAQVEVEVAARLRALTPPGAAEKDVVTRTEVARGPDAAVALAEAAERVGADAVVIASHGRSALGRALLGSVAAGLLERTRKPVFVVRPPADLRGV